MPQTATVRGMGNAISLEGYSLAGRSIAVVGATGILGSACARGVIALNGSLIGSGRSQERLAELQRELPGGSFHHLDLEQRQQWEGCIHGWPELDGVVMATGIAAIKPLRVHPEAEWERLLQINLTLPVQLVRLLLRGRKIKPGASLVFISSIAGRCGSAGYTAYSASKAGMAGMVRSLARELAPSGIRVNCLAPGLVESGMATALDATLSTADAKAYASRYPLGIGTPEAVATPALFLLSPASQWITGTELVVDGGASC